MTILQALILGVIQGITEFLPISSSGHLVIVPFLLGWNLPQQQAFTFDVLIQFSTLFAVLIYYQNDIIQIAKAMWKNMREKKPFASVPSRIGWLTLLATIPAGLVGFFFQDIISDAFSNPQLAAGFLLVTALLLIVSEIKGKQTRDLGKLNWKDAILMGLSQAISVFPGVSRSGSTISGGLFRDLNRKAAGQFAFLMAIPIMTAAGFLSLLDLLRAPELDGFFAIMAVGFITSGVVGFFAINWLLKFISDHSMIPFAIYCAIVGIGTLTISFISAPNTDFIADKPMEVPITITYQSSVSWLLPDMQTCLLDLDYKKSILIKKDDAKIVPEQASVHISFGKLSSLPIESYQIGNDALVIAANQENPIADLPIKILINVLSGEISSYDALFDACPSCISDSGNKESFNIWRYPNNHPLQDLANEYTNTQFSSTSFIAPTPLQMVQVLNTDENSIGALPGKMLDENLKTIMIINGNERERMTPILANSQEEINEVIKDWLLCVQNAVK